MEHVDWGSHGSVYDQSQMNKTDVHTDSLQENPSLEATAKQQATKPSALDVTKNIVGYGLIGLGVGTGLALAPIAIPLGMLGGGIGLAVGKGLEKFSKNTHENAGTSGAVIGISIGTLLTGALILGGGLLIKNADRKKEHLTQPLESMDEALAKVADPLGSKVALNDMRASFKRNVQYELVHIPDNDDHAFNNFLLHVNKEITLHNELVELLHLNYPDLHIVEEKLAKVEEFQQNTNEACLHHLLNDDLPESQMKI